MALAAAAPLPAAAVTHPESTQLERPGTPVDRVRIRVLDKIEARQVVMAVPMGITVPLPDAIHSLRVTRYSRDFALEGITSGNAGAKREGGSSGTASEQESGAEAKPVPREDGQSNPAARLQVLRDGETLAESWVFARAPYLFQPPNMRYTFVLLGAPGPEKGTERP